MCALKFERPIANQGIPVCLDKTPLWQLTQDFREVAELLEKDWDAVDEAEGVDLEHLELALLRLKADREVKIENCLKLYHSYRARRELVMGEITRLRAFEGKFNRCASNLKAYLEGNIQASEKFSFASGAISWRNSESVKPDYSEDGETLVPKEYQRVSISPDLTKMKEALKAGIEIKGWNLLKKNNIQLK